MFDSPLSSSAYEILAVAWDADDETLRRAYRVRLTPRGRRQFNTMAQAHEGWIVDAFAGLDAAEIKTLRTLLGKVKEHFQETA